MGSSEEQTQVQDEPDDYLFAMQLATASVLPMALKAAIELNLLEIMAQAGPGAKLTPHQLAAQLPTQNPKAATMLDRILRLLASNSILTCSFSSHKDGKFERSYGLGPVCRFLVPNSDGVSIAPLVLMNHDKVFMETWYHLMDAVLEGGVAFDKAHGMNAFEYPGTDPRFNSVFNKAMMDHTTLTMNKVMETYRGLEGVREVVDVGGGIGATLKIILSRYPQIKGTNFDLPHVIAHAPDIPGVEHVGGDMFESVPRGETIFMKWILHDWADDECLKLLNNCYNALPESGKVIVVESILPVAPTTSLSSNVVFRMDMLMFAYNPGGKERTEEEFKALAKGAGFAGVKVLCCVYNSWVMELYKNM